MNMGQNIRVLVIEDEKTIRDYIARKLEEVWPACKVVAKAYNGQKGLKLIREFEPDVVFTDIRMPIMDGIAMMADLRATHPDLPIVVLSGYDEFEYARQSMKYGVFEYLLKPPSEETLKQTVDKLSKIVHARNKSIERSMISSRLSGGLMDNHLPVLNGNPVFLLFLVGIGNLCTALTSVSLQQRFSAVWDNVDWEETVETLELPVANWWVIDENRSNQKFLIVSLSEGKKPESCGIAERLLNTIRIAAAPYNVTVAVYTSPSAASLWDTAQEMRATFERSVVICSSRMIHEKSESIMIPHSALLNTNRMNQLNSLLEAKNKSAFQRFVFDLLEAWKASGYPQRTVEKALAEMMSIVLANDLGRKMDRLDWESLLQERISASTDYENVQNAVWGLLEQMLPEERKDPAEELADQIEHYLTEHYTENVSLEELAKKFGFTSAYLSKIFRKFKDDSPHRFLTALRIEEAKRLMLEHPDLDAKIIAEMVGYTDHHYFSKVFKNLVGIKSTDFRNTASSAMRLNGGIPEH